MRIYLVRHGETEWNRLGRLQGRGDSPLTPLGVAQAQAYGRLLADEIAEPAKAALITSPLGRARQTAGILRAALPFAPERCSESELLAEMSMGLWEGLTRAEIEVRFPGALAAREAEPWSYVIPRGESYAQIRDRAAGWLRIQPPGEVLVAVAHGMLSRALRGAFLGLAGSAALELPSHVHGQIFVLEGGRSRVLEAAVPPLP